MAFSLSMKPTKKRRFPVVSEAGGKQDFGCKVRLTAKLKTIRITDKVNMCMCMCVCVCVDSKLVAAAQRERSC